MMEEKIKQAFFFRFPLMVSHLMRVTIHGKFAVLVDSFQYFFRYLSWRISLAVIKPLNFLRETSFIVMLRKWICKLLMGKYFVGVAKPVNLEACHSKRFQNDYYVLKPLRILQLRDCWIYLTAYSGIAFRNLRILPGSIHGKWDKRNVTLLKEYYPLTMNSWMYAYHEKNTAFTELSDNKNYLLCHHWFNYYHWLTETVLRMWMTKEKINEYVLLLPETFKEIKFVQQSLQALDVRNVQYVNQGILHVKNFTLIENKPYCNHYFPEAAKQIGNFFSDYVKGKEIVFPDFGDKIFISRKKSERRKMVNEDEIYHMLSTYGFKSVAFEDFDFFQQVAILSKAKYLIGMHGAGLTNMMFMPQGSKVLEFHREIYSSNDLHSDVYWKLASALGHKYYYQFCEPTSKEEDFFTVDYKVDPNKLKENIGVFLK